MAVIIEIKNQQKRIPLNPTQIRRIAKKILNQEGVSDVSLSFVFVTDHAIQIINKQFRRHNCATDVLAFDFSEQNRTGPRVNKKKSLDGEIIISTTTACRNARRFKTSPMQEVVLYMTHGILHLTGHDDHSRQSRARMKEREQEVLRHVYSRSTV